MFWDGGRWIGEHAPRLAPARRGRRRRRLLALSTAVLLLVFIAPAEGTSASTADRLVATWGTSYETTVVQEGSRQIKYQGTWSRLRNTGYLGGAAKFSRERGASLTFRFTGTAVTWIGPRRPQGSSVRLYLDGRYVKTINLRAHRFRARQTLFTAYFPTAESHTLKIVALGTAPRTWVTVDAFVVRGKKKTQAVAPPAAPATTPVPTPVPTAEPTLLEPATTPTPWPTGVSRALGVYVHNSAWDSVLLDAYDLQAGSMPTFATTYQMWGTSGDGSQFDTTMLDAFAARGILNILTWQPFDWNTGGAQPAFALSTVLSGAHDATIQTWVAAAKAYGKPVYIRFAHEMNGDFYPWGQGVNGNTPTQFVAVWKYVVGLFRAGGATNVRWVWSPNVIGASGQYPLAGLYPGDAYVDLIGLDGYNWGTGGLGEVGWRSFTQIFGATYDQVRALAPSKPIYIAEMASAEAGGDKAAWISSAFLTEVPRRFPALVGVVWFDAFGAMQLVTPAQNADWAVDSSPSALAAFRNVVASPEWRGTLR